MLFLAPLTVVVSDNGIIKTLDQPVYLVRVKGKQIHYLDRSGRPSTLDMDPTEYRFKLALVRNNYEEVLHIIRTSNLVGQSIIAYLQKKGFPEVCMRVCGLRLGAYWRGRLPFTSYKTRTRDSTSLLNAEISTLHWRQPGPSRKRNAGSGWLNKVSGKGITRCVVLAALLLAIIEHWPQIVEIAYQKTKNFDKLSFLYMATGSSDKLLKMGKIAEARGDPMSKFQNTLYSGDVTSRVHLLRDVGLRKLTLLLSLCSLLKRIHRAFGVSYCTQPWARGACRGNPSISWAK